MMNINDNSGKYTETMLILKNIAGFRIYEIKEILFVRCNQHIAGFVCCFEQLISWPITTQKLFKFREKMYIF